MSTKLLLIRHGQTPWNIKKRYCGTRNIGLSIEGKKQAKLLAQRLKDELIHRVYASDKKRAIQTAKIIFKGTKINQVPDLKEMHFGVFEGLTCQEVMKKYPGIYKKWISNPFSVTIPQGESLADFRKRVARALRKIALANKNKTIAIVCHGGTISAFITMILKSKDFWKHIPQPASLSIVEYKDGRAKIKLANDTAHLI